MSAPVPTLASTAWVTSVAEKADQLVSYYFVAEDSQTHMYPGHVVSLPKQVQELGHDQLELRMKVRDDLQRYLSPYFDEVSVDVTTDNPVPEDLNRTNITVSCRIVDKGVAYSLGRLVTTINSKIVQIVDINNNGA